MRRTTLPPHDPSLHFAPVTLGAGSGRKPLHSSLAIRRNAKCLWLAFLPRHHYVFDAPGRFALILTQIKGYSMRLIPDVDVLILMATALASKRRPATLVEIVAAADLIQGAIPFVEKLGEAIQRLSSVGLISAAEGGFTLTPLAQEIMADQPRNADTEERIVAIKGNLAAYTPKGEYSPILLTREQLSAAILEHKTSRRTPGKNLLMPKPKLDRHFKVEGRWRRASATRGRKS
jgi:hypothetical protein